MKKVAIKKKNPNIVQSITNKYKTCYKNNPDTNKKIILEVTKTRKSPRKLLANRFLLKCHAKKNTNIY